MTRCDVTVSEVKDGRLVMVGRFVRSSEAIVAAIRFAEAFGGTFVVQNRKGLELYRTIP